MPEYTGYVVGKNGNQHEILIDFEYRIQNNSIGWFEYWGSVEYDFEPDYMEIDDIKCAWIVLNNRKRRIYINSSWIDDVIQQAEYNYDWKKEIDNI